MFQHCGNGVFPRELAPVGVRVPEGCEDAVSHKDAEAVHQRQLHADVVEVVVGARQ